MKSPIKHLHPIPRGNWAWSLAPLDHLQAHRMQVSAIHWEKMAPGEGSHREMGDTLREEALRETRGTERSPEVPRAPSSVYSRFPPSEV